VLSSAAFTPAWQKPDFPDFNERHSMQSLTSHGITIPRLGLGTYRLRGMACRQAVASALALGYRHIDTAAMYENEAAVGAAVSASGVRRADLFIATKVWHDQLTPDGIRRALDRSLKVLGLTHVDLYMVHWPAPDMDLSAVMETMEDLRSQGGTRAIGVCNFNLSMLRRVVQDMRVPLASVQVEHHPFLAQSRLLSFLREHGIPLTAYAPLAQGRAATDQTLARIGTKHGVSASQVAIAWLLGQDSVIAIPKAERLESQQANLDALQLQLDDEDRAAIAELPKDLRYVQPSFAPAWDADQG
jgi:2,5-diketo-D-gluconate reductase B